MQSLLTLSATLSPLGHDARLGLQQLAGLGLRHVQLSAMQQATRPRNLSQSARRDLLATMRRLELTCSGIDLWIPPDHFVEDEHQQRAVDAAIATIELAMFFDHVPVSLQFPNAGVAESAAVQSVIEKAVNSDVVLVDFVDESSAVDPRVGVGIDTAALLSRGQDPSRVVLAHASHLAAVRVSDLNSTGMRMPFGSRDGRLDVAALKATIDVAGYERPVVIDARQWEYPLRGIEQTMREFD